MSSTTEHQKEIPPRSDSISPSKDDGDAPLSESHDNMASPAKQTGSAKNELATQLAALKVTDENVASEKLEDNAVDKACDDDEFFSDEEAEQEQEYPVKVDENTHPKLTAETALKPEDAGGVSVKENEEATTTPKSDEQQVSQTIEINPKFATETAREKEVTSSVSAKQTEEATTTTTSKSDDEEQVSHPVKKVDENANSKLPLDIAPNLEDTIGASVEKDEEATTASKSEEEQAGHQIKVDENVNLGKLTYEAVPKPEDTGSASAKTTEEFTASNSDSAVPAVPTDETATPRLSTYIKLHNDVSPSLAPPTPLLPNPLTPPIR
jgi:hypothetical protein